MMSNPTATRVAFHARDSKNEGQEVSPNKRRKRTLHEWESFLMSDNLKNDEEDNETEFLNKCNSVATLDSTSRPNELTSGISMEDERAKSFGALTRKSYGISDLFATAVGNSNGGEHVRGNDNCRPYTFRMERRYGGAGCGQHHNEERLILFRSDRPACIGKIVYSSQGPKHTFLGGSKERDSFFQKRHPDAQWCDRRDLEIGKDDADALASAKIHVLDVKPEYRGRDFGGLLFHEAISSLLDSYNHIHKSDEEQKESEKGYSQIRDQLSSSFSLNASEDVQYARNPTILCELDAEEDTRRHNKLIHFYEDLGCQIKPKAKVRYINNNDGETYRKVTMQIPLRVLELSLKSHQDRPVTPDNASKGNAKIAFTRPVMFSEAKTRISTSESTLVRQKAFLPVRLALASDPKQLKVSVKTRCRLDSMNIYGRVRKLEWIISDCPEQGGVSFRTTQGWHLCVEPNGEVVANRPLARDWECFILRRVLDVDGCKSSTDGTDPGNDHLGEIDSSEMKEFWTLQTCHDTFLTVDRQTQTLATSDHPIFWTVDPPTWTLACTMDYPQRRLFYQKNWETQSVKYVLSMREKYLRFDRAKMTLKQALDIVQTLPWYRFCKAPKAGEGAASLRSYLFHTAEICRDACASDWMVVIALIHDLARVLTMVTSASFTSETDFDWTITFRTRVIGCSPPPSAKFPEYQTLNPDRRNPSCTTETGIYKRNVGLDNAMLSWSGPEYMYHMLRYNSTHYLPTEALKVLRYFLLRDWHSENAYAALTDESDENVKSRVRLFDDVINRAKRTGFKELSNEETERLWQKHYHELFRKYKCCDVLEW